MKNIFFSCLLLIFSQKFLPMDDCIANKLVEVQKQTWPLRGQLEVMKKFFIYHKKNTLTNEQQERLKWHHHAVTKSLDHVLTQCDHARMHLAEQKFSQVDEYLKKAHAHLKQASVELTDYKLVVKSLVGIDFDSTDLQKSSISGIGAKL